MSWLSMICRSLRQNALSTTVTVGSIALAAALLLSVWVLKEQSRRSFTQVDAGFDGVLGARGSKLQLVLNSIFHLESSPGNITMADFQEIAKSPHVGAAVPIAVGDNYEGIRIVGTTLDLFRVQQERVGSSNALIVEAPGRLFHAGLQEAVIGHFAAQRLRLQPGDKFHPSHGINEDADHEKEHAEDYLVVGILKPFNNPLDRVIWIPLEGVQSMSGHAVETREQISAVLVKLRPGNAQAGFLLDRLYNKQGSRLTFAWPIGAIMSQLFDKISWFDHVLGLVAVLVALVAAASILASIYNTMNERRRDIAVLRALGARRRMVTSLVVGEATLIGFIGSLIGLGLYLLLFSGVAWVVRRETGVVLEVKEWNAALLWVPALLIGLSALAGIIPAWKAYRTDAVRHL